MHFCSLFLQASISCLSVSKLGFQNRKDMFDFGTNRGFFTLAPLDLCLRTGRVMLLNKSGKCLAGQGVAPTVYRQFAQYPQNSKPAFLHYALVCMPKAHHICSCVRSPYRFLKFNAATKQPNAPFTLQHIRSAFSHKNP